MTLHRLVVVLALPAVLVARDAPAQMCIGTTTLLVRDQSGRLITGDRLNRLGIRDIDGVPLRLQTPSRAGEPAVYEYQYPGRFAGADTTYTSTIRMTNPIVLGSLDTPIAFCGQIGEVTLDFEGRMMRLLVDIWRHNTYYEIESPVFQDGTFRLRALTCADGAPPPRIDNRTAGRCVVTSDKWDGTDKDWVRYVLPTSMRGGAVSLSAEECRARGQIAITTPVRYTDVWLLHPEVARGDPVPSVDFRRQFVLAVYGVGSGGYSFRSFRVDKQGNLTFEPPRRGPARTPDCSVTFVVLYRSGITSMNGERLAAPR